MQQPADEPHNYKYKNKHNNKQVKREHSSSCKKGPIAGPPANPGPANKSTWPLAAGNVRGHAPVQYQGFKSG